MTLNVTLSDKEVGVDPVSALFRVSAVMSDHVTRTRQQYLNSDIDLGQDVRGRVVAIDYRSVTLKSSNGERRTVPMTPKRAALLTAPPTATKRASPRKQPKSTPTTHAAPPRHP